MDVYVVHAEHFSVPGLIVKVFDSEAKALAECLSLINIMLDDSKLPHADPANMGGCMLVLQDIHGAAHCYVECNKHTVE